MSDDHIDPDEIELLDWLCACPVDACALVVYVKDGHVMCAAKMIDAPDGDRMITEEIRLFAQNKNKGKDMYFNSVTR